MLSQVIRFGEEIDMVDNSAHSDAYAAYRKANPFSHADFVGNAIDQLVTIEAKNLGMPHGVVKPLYDHARELIGGRPLSMVCAEKLVSALRSGDTVLILTGAGYAPTLPQGENDGPPGAASLARALYKGLGVVPVYAVEECHAGPVVASSHAAGLVVKSFEEARDLRLGAACAIAPITQDAVSDWVAEVFEIMKPKAVITTERLGPGAGSVIHNSTGHEWSGPNREVKHDVVDIAPLVDEANKRGILTIGIGDHGNELGFGAIRDTVEKVLPRGDRMGTTTATEIVLPAMMSNWGCYGIQAALAFLLKSPSLVHSMEDERRIVRACLDAGGLEAINCSTDPWVDGLDLESSMACVQLLGNIARKALEPHSAGLTH